MTRKTIRLTDTVTGDVMTLVKITPKQTATFKPRPHYAAASGKYVEQMSRADVKAMLVEMKGRLSVTRVEG